MGYSRNGPNLGVAGTTGPLLQGGQVKQQMNFTTYESGFGATSQNTNNTQQSSNLGGGVMGKSQRQIQEMSAQNPSRNQGLMNNSNNALVKSHQQIAQANNLYSQKQPGIS